MFELSDADLLQLVEKKDKLILNQINEEEQSEQLEEVQDNPRVDDYHSESDKKSEGDFLDMDGDEV